MLLQIPMLKPLSHPACIDGIFLYMLRHILLRSQNANYIDRGEFTLQIHHGDVEIDANIGVLIGIESKGSTQGLCEKCFGFEEEEGGHGDHSDSRENGASTGALKEINGHLAVHVQVGYKGTPSHGWKYDVRVLSSVVAARDASKVRGDGFALK